jgi:mRNA-degrading endonuclease YafQ of YafQ-DinJ toxin-antitoxin module
MSKEQNTEVTNQQTLTQEQLLEQELLKEIDEVMAKWLPIKENFKGHHLNGNDLFDTMFNNQRDEDVELQGENG